MEYLNPSNKLVENIRLSAEIKFKTPQNKRTTHRFSPSPDFSPYNYSSPVKSDKMNSFHGRNNKRYFSRSDSSFNSSGNVNSPFQKQRRINNKQGYGRGRGYNHHKQFSEAPISSYVDSSVTEDPWYELEEELERSREKSSLSDSNPSQTAPSQSLN